MNTKAIDFFHYLFNINVDENLRFKLLKKPLLNVVKLEDILEITFLFAFEYNSEVYEELKIAIENKNILPFSNNHTFNNLSDALEVFIVKKVNSTCSICVFFNPVEYLENEYVLDFIDYNYDIDTSNFRESEIVYKKK